MLIFWLHLSIPSSSFAKRPNISDSLSKVLEKTKMDTIRVNILNKLAAELMYSSIDSASNFCNEALEISRKIQYLKGEAEAIQNLGTLYYFQGNYIKALNLLENAL